MHHTENSLHGVHHTAESKAPKFEKKFAVCISRGDNFAIENLREIESELENTLVFSSGAQMGLNHEIMEVKKLVTHSL